MSNERKGFYENHKGKIAVAALATFVGGVVYDVNFNEVELTNADTGLASVFQVAAIEASSKKGHVSIYRDHGEMPYVFRAPEEKAIDLETGDCFIATVTGLNVAAFNGEIDKLRASEITEVPCPSEP